MLIQTCLMLHLLTPRTSILTSISAFPPQVGGTRMEGPVHPVVLWPLSGVKSLNWSSNWTLLGTSSVSSLRPGAHTPVLLAQAGKESSWNMALPQLLMAKVMQRIPMRFMTMPVLACWRGKQ